MSREATELLTASDNSQRGFPAVNIYCQSSSKSILETDERILNGRVIDSTAREAPIENGNLIFVAYVFNWDVVEPFLTLESCLYNLLKVSSCFRFHTPFGEKGLTTHKERPPVLACPKLFEHTFLFLQGLMMCFTGRIRL